MTAGVRSPGTAASADSLYPSGMRRTTGWR